MFGCVQNRTRLRWRQVAWAQRGLVPAWKGEVVHPGAPESKCVYKIWQFAGSCQCSLYEIDSIISHGITRTLRPIRSLSFLNGASRATSPISSPTNLWMEAQ